MPKADITEVHPSHNKYQIEIITQSDIPAIIQIEQLAHDFPWSQALFETNFGEKYLNLKILSVQETGTLTHEHELVGYAIVQIILDEATLFNIAISPNFQRQGYAKALLSDLSNRLEKVGVNTLWLEVRASNQPAILLYEQLGFNEVTIRKGYYPTKKGDTESMREDAIVMAKYI